MKTYLKILLTFGVLTLFILVIAGLIVFFSTGFGSAPSLGGGLGGGYVAVIPIKGEITSGGCGGSLLSGPVACANADDFKNSIEEANDNWMISAILLDIDSGGGSVVATRTMTYAVKNSKKPVVAYIGETGASGAYYAASAAKRIIADKNSITGSIGVRMNVMQYYELMSKLGVNMTVIKAGADKDVGSPYRPMTEGEQEELQRIVDKTYDDFIETVARNRNLTPDYVRSIADGKLYLGSEAKELRLIDQTGSFDDALAIAAKEGGIIGEPKVKRMDSGSSLGGIFESEASNVVIYSIAKYLGG
ncbi:MAG: signal peptide peptidase SppA [Candidatus Altiarchaeota archaeon]|nr:signal peptide peptidase SppA [Candidatus Altiarchaeota archaeon]